MTRFYFPNPTTGPAADVLPAFRSVANGHAGGWGVVTSANQRKLIAAPKGNTGRVQVQRTNGVATTVNRLITQWVSDPIRGGLITGKCNSIQRWNEDNGANNAATQGILYVVSNDGSIVRGILFNFDNVTSTSGSFEFQTTGANRVRWPRGGPAGGVAMTPVLAQEGDRIVFEMGYRAAATNASRFGNVEHGDPTSGDQADATGSTAATTATWLDVGQDIGLDVFAVRSYRHHAAVLG